MKNENIQKCSFCKQLKALEAFSPFSTICKLCHLRSEEENDDDEGGSGGKGARKGKDAKNIQHAIELEIITNGELQRHHAKKTSQKLFEANQDTEKARKTEFKQREWLTEKKDEKKAIAETLNEEESTVSFFSHTETKQKSAVHLSSVTNFLTQNHFVSNKKTRQKQAKQNHTTASQSRTLFAQHPTLDAETDDSENVLKAIEEVKKVFNKR